MSQQRFKRGARRRALILRAIIFFVMGALALVWATVAYVNELPQMASSGVNCRRFLPVGGRIVSRRARTHTSFLPLVLRGPLHHQGADRLCEAVDTLLRRQAVEMHRVMTK